MKVAKARRLGCGGGRDSKLMIQRGFVVDATDGCPEIARKAQKRIRQPVRVMRFDELEAYEEYDAVWAHGSLLHVPRSGLTALLGLVWQALRPGGCIAVWPLLQLSRYAAVARDLWCIGSMGDRDDRSVYCRKLRTQRRPMGRSNSTQDRMKPGWQGVARPEADLLRIEPTLCALRF